MVVSMTMSSYPPYKNNASKNGFVLAGIFVVPGPDAGYVVGPELKPETSPHRNDYEYPMYQNFHLNQIMYDVIKDCGVVTLLCKGNSPTGTRDHVFMYVDALEHRYTPEEQAVSFEFVQHRLNALLREAHRQGPAPVVRSLFAPSVQQPASTRCGSLMVGDVDVMSPA
jgi:hypothetical protein